MAAKQINQYVENKYTDDIVYHFSNDEIHRYRKTDDGVLFIHISRKGKITERLLPESEFPLSEFDRMKSVSDEDYRERNKGDVQEYRNTVSLTDLEETRICSQELSAEDEYINSLNDDEESGDDYRTLENGMKILDKCLTGKQKHRFILYHLHGLTQEEIADGLGLKQQTINQSLKEADKKIKKFFARQAKTTCKIASKMYIGEGQEKQKKSNLS